MNKKTCIKCGCSRETMIQAKVQIKREIQMGLKWLCFPCLFKFVTKTSLSIVDESIYHEFMKDSG